MILPCVPQSNSKHGSIGGKERVSTLDFLLQKSEPGLWSFKTC